MVTQKTPDTLIAFLREDTPPPPLIFIHGPDTYTRNRLIARIVDRYLPNERDRVFGLEEFEARDADPAHLLSALKTLPMGQKLKIVVLQRFELASSSVLKEQKKRDATPTQDTSSDLDEILLRYLTHPSRNTLLVISSATGLRKNSRLFRALPKKTLIVSCATFSPAEAIRFVQKALSERGKQAPPSWVEHFVEMVGPDAARLSGELKKVLLLTADRETLTEQDLDIVSATEMPRDVFALLNAVSAGQKGASMEIMREILRSTEPPLRILAVLSWHYHLVLKAWELLQSGDQGGMRRIHPSQFVVKKVTRQARNMSRKQLREIFARLRETDRLLKGSRLPPAQVMERLAFTLSSLEAGRGR